MFYLGSDKPCRSVVDHSMNEGYPEHIHDNLELIYITAGTRKCNIGGREYSEPTASLTVIFPFQPHGFPDSPGAEYYWIGVNPMFMPELRGLLFEYTPGTPVISAERLGRSAELAAYLFSSPPDTCEITLDALALALVSGLLDELSLNKREMSRVGCEVLPIIAAHCDESDLTIVKLSKMTGISPRELTSFFKTAFGVTFGGFLRKFRLDNAVRMLDDKNMSITEIAFESGFSSVRTFNRCFREIYGKTPSDYRNDR